MGVDFGVRSRVNRAGVAGARAAGVRSDGGEPDSASTQTSSGPQFKQKQPRSTALDAEESLLEFRELVVSAGGEVITEIEDTGKGIAPEILPRLFEAFATFGKAKGTGLGLSICKKVIEDHRGWIRARSEPGKGAVFSFSLPVNAKAAA